MRYHPQISREDFRQLARKFLYVPCVLHASLEALLRGKNEIFTQHSTACWKALMFFCMCDGGKCTENSIFYARHMQDSCVIYATFPATLKASVVSHTKFSWQDQSSGKCSRLHASRVTILEFLEKTSHNLHENSRVIPASSMLNPREFRGFVARRKWNIHAGQLKIRTFPQAALYHWQTVQ